ESGNFGREIIIGSAFAADGGDRKDEVADIVFLFKAAAFAEEEAGFWLNGAEEVHGGGGAGAAHAEVDDRNAAGCGVEHGAIQTAQLDVVPFRERADIIAEIDQENI